MSLNVNGGIRQYYSRYFPSIFRKSTTLIWEESQKKGESFMMSGEGRTFLDLFWSFLLLWFPRARPWMLVRFQNVEKWAFLFE